MDPFSFLQTIAPILAFLVVFILFRSIISLKGSKQTKSKTIIYNQKVPELSCGLPFIGHLHLFSDKIPYFRTFSNTAEKYGPIFSLRLGCRNTIVVSSREIAKECLTIKDKVFASRPDTVAGRYLGYNNAIFGLAPYGLYWREIRKIAILELLSSHRLEKLKHIRDREIYSLVKDLYKSCMKICNGSSIQVPITISKLLEHMTSNINVQMIAGKQFSSDENKEDTMNSESWRLKKAIRDATYLSGVFVVEDAIPSLGWLDFKGYVGSMKRTFKEIDLILDKWLHEHLKKKAEEDENGGGGCDENDFMDVLISTFEEHDVIYGHKRDIVIKATTLMLILTGSGSTAITLTWALSLLLNHPSILTSAQEELDTKIGKNKWVKESDIKDLKFLRAIVKETLRLYPPAPLTGIREAIDNTNLAGYNIKKGTRLLINLWKIQRDPEIWSNPDEFQPERFMNNDDEYLAYFPSQNFEFLPFSYGRRMCPGMTFGLQVLLLTLARLLQGFEIRTKDGVGVDMIEGLGVALPKQNAFEVVLTPRLPLELYEKL